MSVPSALLPSLTAVHNGSSPAPRYIFLPRFAGDGDQDTGCPVLWEDVERVYCRGWRPGDNGGRSAVLVVLPIATHPSRASLDRLSHEFGLKDELDEAWAVRPLELAHDGAQTMLVLEDVDGFEPLERLLGSPMEMRRFLRVAARIASAVSKLHRRGLLHKDIKPVNILVNRAAEEVKLTGFGVASRLPRERQTAGPPQTIAGTLAYMAPEQTGRMNRSIDSRTDLYALGVTFYQMLTGTLPFTASDPMEWVHCHVARRPVPPNEQLREIPSVISAIVMKLLAKTAEERYQTAAGLETDLRRALAELESKGQIGTFSLGADDVPDQLLTPERLYGREGAITSLLAAFDKVVTAGGPELVLIAGHAGMGKSAVVHELQRALVPRLGLFASGKFDQHQVDVPYASLAQALNDLVRPLLGRGEAELAQWRAALATALGPSGRLMTTLVPDLELLIGPQPPIPDLPPKDAQSRFQFVIRRLLGVFARPEHPLALFLDDLQWLDAATLDLLEDLQTQPDLRHLLLIGAYRADEVTAAHPLMRRVAAIRQSGGQVLEIVLKPLRLENVGQMIADALHCDRDRARPLARLVHKKTAGNPFFANQFLTALFEEGLLHFDHGSVSWAWDLKRIRSKGYTDNVSDLMVGKLRRLPTTTQAALKALTCLGSHATFATLALVRGKSEEALHQAIWPAVRAGLIMRQDGSYRFLHDRIQEAAYALVSESRRAEAHLTIGRLLVANTPPDALEGRIFDIVGQLNRGASRITLSEERERLAELNSIAGHRAKASAAYASTLMYLTTSAAQLPGDAWDRRYELAFAIELQRAECEFLTGALVDAEVRLVELENRAKNLVDLSSVTRLRVDLYMTLGRSDRAVAVGLDYLRRVGIAWPAHPMRHDVEQEYACLWRQLGDRPIEALLDLPRMTNPVAGATLDVLTSMVTPALFTDENLRGLVIGRMGNLNLEHGNSDTSCYTYTAVGNVLALYFGDYDRGFRFAQLGLDQVEQHGTDRLKARVYLAFGNLAKVPIRHASASRPLARHAFETAQRAGDLTYAAFSCNNILTQLLASGDPLSDVQGDAEAGLDFARQARFRVVIGLITAQLQLVRTLRGLTPAFGCFDDAEFNEARFEEQFQSVPSFGIVACLYWIRKLQALVLASEPASALAASAKAERLLWMSPAIFERADYHFYSALTLAVLWDSASDDDRPQHHQALISHHRRLEEWTDHSAENFASRSALIGAEIARLEGRAVDAEHLYETAIQLARTHGLIHNEAIAYERAAAFYKARAFDRFATLYLQSARRCYLRWGADGKVRQLDALSPHLTQDDPEPRPMRTIEAPVEHLDLSTVMRLSQAISGEIVLEKLIDSLLRMGVEQAGAERGLLILLHDNVPRITAEAITQGDSVDIRLRNEVPSATMLAQSVLHYVMRTRQTVSLEDALAEHQFAPDPYITLRAARSLLCIPLITQTKLIGVLYLENNLAPRVFVPARTAVLKLLASQAAIALEIARLHNDLAEREARIRRLVEANLIPMFVGDRDGPIVEANEAFLRLVGYDREDLVARRLRWTDLTPPEGRDRDQEAIAELNSTGRLRPFEKEYVRKDGSRVPVLLGAAALEDSSNLAVAFVFDLTGRKRAEDELRTSAEALRRSEAYLTEAQRLSHTGTVAFNANAPLYWSEESYRIWELDPIKGLPHLETVLQRIHPDDRERVNVEIQEAVLQKRDFSLEFRIVLPDESVKYIEGTGRPWFSADGELVQMVATHVDVTDRKRTQEERERLRQLESDLAHVNRLSIMGEMTATLAHEILHPIATARNNARAAARFLDLKPPDLKEVKDALDCVVRDSDRATDIVSRIRAHMKKASPRYDRFDFNEAINEVIVMVQSAIDKSGVSVQSRLAVGPLPVRGDRVQLQQVLLNLIMNAVEAMSAVEDGVRELSISTGNSQSGGVLVAIGDTGPGIDEEKIERVFQPFYTTKTSGMGMGLSICRSIIGAHGGRLWAAANQPKGALFQITLPPDSDS
jgi:PAS domain S-box-containing protein